MLEIPLSSDAEQIFSIPLDGTLYNFRVIYNTRLGVWSMDISQGSTELCNGITLVSGVDLLSSYRLDLKYLYVFNIVDPSQDATADNLGTDVRLYKLTEEENINVSSV